MTDRREDFWIASESGPMLEKFKAAMVWVVAENADLIEIQAQQPMASTVRVELQYLRSSSLNCRKVSL
jgi:hypothetical protein